MKTEFSLQIILANSRHEAMIKTTLLNMQEKVHHRVTTGGELAVMITHPSRFCNDLDICYLLETYN